jgi:hypothetical protein
LGREEETPLAEEVRDSTPEGPEVHPRLRELFDRIEKLPMSLQVHVVGLLDSMLNVHDLFERLARPEERRG